MKLLNTFIASILIVASLPVMASNIYIRPRASTTSDIFFSDSASSYALPNLGFAVKTTVNCYGTNLRGVANPISPTSTVKMQVNLRAGADFSVLFPGFLVMAGRGPTDIYGTDKIFTFLAGQPNVMKATATRNTINFNVPDSVGHVVSFGVNGKADRYDVSQRSSLIKAISFTQDMRSNFGVLRTVMNKPVDDWGVQKALKNLMRPYRLLSDLNQSFAGGGDGDGGDGGAHFQPVPINAVIPGAKDPGWGQPMWAVPAGVGGAANNMYMGQEGPLSGSWEATWSSDFKTLSINASFPGQNGFCGGFFSPLMLFFNDQRPDYTAKVNFRMNSYSDKSYWPEASNSSGYFLALDRNGDGIINDVSELFGSEDTSSNGFELLRVFDENGDGKIDAKDPIFSQLLLWKDSTGKAVTLKKDLKSLSQMGVTEISLDYTRNAVKTYGARAEEREKSHFKFNKSGSQLKGEVIDVWFATH